MTLKHEKCKQGLSYGWCIELHKMIKTRFRLLRGNSSWICNVAIKYLHCCIPSVRALKALLCCILECVKWNISHKKWLCDNESKLNFTVASCPGVTWLCSLPVEWADFYSWLDYNEKCVRARSRAAGPHLEAGFQQPQPLPAFINTLTHYSEHPGRRRSAEYKTSLIFPPVFCYIFWHLQARWRNLNR